MFKKLYEVDVLKEIDVDLKSKVQARCLCVTDLGKKIGLSAVATNSLLEEANLQTCSYRKGHKVWTATEEGKKYSEYLDTGKKHGNGEPIQSLKWYETVLDHDKVKQMIEITKEQPKKAAPAATVMMTPSERLEHLHETRANENGLYTE